MGLENILRLSPFNQLDQLTFDRFRHEARKKNAVPVSIRRMKQKDSFWPENSMDFSKLYGWIVQVFDDHVRGDKVACFFSER
jgi:hypothetical protein